MFHYVVEIPIEPFQEPGSESLAEGSVSLYPFGLAEPFWLEGRFILAEGKVVFPSSLSIAITQSLG